MQESRLNLVFLLPLIYRPLKDNVAKKYGLLSERCAGHIFTLSSRRYKGLAVSNFKFYSKIHGEGLGNRVLNGVLIQVFWPLLLLWRKSRIDVIVAYDPYRSALSGIVLKYFLRTKLVVEINGDYQDRKQDGNWLKKWLMRILFHFSVRHADAIKVLNSSQEAYVKRLLPYKRVYRFPNFVAVEYFCALDCYQGDYIIAIGYPFWLKGMDVLILAFKRIAEKHPKIKLRIMGYCSDEEINIYKEMAENESRIEFIKPGWIEDVGEQLRGCYALVNAARSEAMGRVHVEAMACRKPIVATRTNGAVECVVEGRTGLLCEIEDVEDLANKLDSLLSNRDRALKMGQAGFERIETEFSEAKYTQSFISMLNEVIMKGKNS